MTETQARELLAALQTIKATCESVEHCGESCPMFGGVCLVKADFPKYWKLPDAPILQPRVFGGTNG
ncbi:MAG: hypothetical protein HFE44_17255 [Oscillospiraceae bacterium]|nr:hypothetical protein [Oscillospiraceae bacterium]